MQPEPSLSSEPQVQAPVGSEESNPKPKKPIFKIILFVILILAAGGLGYWAFQANTNLKAAQGSLAELQDRYDTLSAEKNSLSSEYSATSSELEQVNAELATATETLTAAKADLEKAKGNERVLRGKMDSAKKYIDIMRGMFEDNDNAVVTLIKVSAVNDTKLKELYANYFESGKPTDLTSWISYLLTTVEKALTP